MQTKEQKRARALLRPMRQRADLAAQDFARARGDVAMLEELIARLERSLAVHNEFARQLLLAPSPGGRVALGRGAAASAGITDLTFYRKCVADIAAELADCRQRLSLASKTMQRRQDELLEARKQHMVFEQLAEKADTVAGVESNRRTTAEMDQTHEAQRSWQQFDPAAMQE